MIHVGNLAMEMFEFFDDRIFFSKFMSTRSPDIRPSFFCLWSSSEKKSTKATCIHYKNWNIHLKLHWSISSPICIRQEGQKCMHSWAWWKFSRFNKTLCCFYDFNVLIWQIKHAFTCFILLWH